MWLPRAGKPPKITVDNLKHSNRVHDAGGVVPLLPMLPYRT